MHYQILSKGGIEFPKFNVGGEGLLGTLTFLAYA